MDLDTEPSRTATPSANPVGLALQLPFDDTNPAADHPGRQGGEHEGTKEEDGAVASLRVASGQHHPVVAS
jgi:hypothetical protein